MVSLKDRFKNLKDVRKNWKVVKSNPYAYQKFVAMGYKGVIILVGCLITLQIILAIINVSSGNSPYMSLLTRAVMVLVGVVIIGKLYNAQKLVSNNIKHYEANPVMIENMEETKKQNPLEDINYLLEKYGDKK